MTSSEQYRNHEEIVLESLKDIEYAVEYLNASIEADDPAQLLLALRRVADARGMGMTELAKHANINRGGIYRILSKQGNPEYLTLVKLMDALGFGIQLTARKSKSKEVA